MKEKKKGAPRQNKNASKGKHPRTVFSLSGAVNDHVIDALQGMGYRVTPKVVAKAVELALEQIDFSVVRYAYASLLPDQERRSLSEDTLQQPSDLALDWSEPDEAQASISNRMQDDVQHDMQWIRTCYDLKIDRLEAVVDRLEALSSDASPTEREMNERWYARPAWQRPTTAFFSRRCLQAKEIVSWDRQSEHTDWMMADYPEDGTVEEKIAFVEQQKQAQEQHRQGIDIDYREERIY